MTTSSASVGPRAAARSTMRGVTGLTRASRRASTSASGVSRAMRCRLSGSTIIARVIIILSFPAKPVPGEPSRRKTRPRDREDAQFARTQMSIACATRAQSSDRAESRRHAHRRVHGPAHGHRYPELAEPDRRSARIERARGRRAGVSYPQTLSKQSIARDGALRAFTRIHSSPLNPEFVAFATLGDVEEQLVERESPLDQTLLVRIGHETLEILGVAFGQPVFPGVRAEDALLLLPALAVPSERDDARILHSFHGERLGFFESLVQVDRHPRIPLDDLPLDTDDVHDRKNAGPAIEGDLLLLVVWKQPPHPLIPGRQRPDQIGRQQRVDFTLDQHVLERFVLWHLRDLEARWRREIDVLVELTEPLDRFVRHAVIVLEDAAHPQAGGEQITLSADLAADKVGRLADALRRIDEDKAMTEAAMGKNRNRAERKILIPRRHVTRARHLGEIELAAAQKPPVPRRRSHIGQHREVDPLRAYAAFLQGAHDLVIAAGEGELESARHLSLSLGW